MNKPLLAAFALLVGTAPLAALAAPMATVVDGATAAATVQTIAVHRSRSTVHHASGQRFDVPNSLLRNRDTLINGLAPASMQFN